MWCLILLLFFRFCSDIPGVKVYVFSRVYSYFTRNFFCFFNRSVFVFGHFQRENENFLACIYSHYIEVVFQTKKIDRLSLSTGIGVVIFFPFSYSDIPGVRKEDLRVQMLSDNTLSISGERRREETKTGDNWFRSERSFGR